MPEYQTWHLQSKLFASKQDLKSFSEKDSCTNYIFYIFRAHLAFHTGALNFSRRSLSGREKEGRRGMRGRGRENKIWVGVRRTICSVVIGLHVTFDLEYITSINVRLTFRHSSSCHSFTSLYSFLLLHVCHLSTLNTRWGLKCHVHLLITSSGMSGIRWMYCTDMVAATGFPPWISALWDYDTFKRSSVQGNCGVWTLPQWQELMLLVLVYSDLTGNCFSWKHKTGKNQRIWK